MYIPWGFHRDLLELPTPDSGCWEDTPTDNGVYNNIHNISNTCKYVTVYTLYTM